MYTRCIPSWTVFLLDVLAQPPQRESVSGVKEDTHLHFDSQAARIVKKTKGREKKILLAEAGVLQSSISSQTEDTAFYKFFPPPGTVFYVFHSLFSIP